jgi:hypothetical protein
MADQGAAPLFGQVIPGGSVCVDSAVVPKSVATAFRDGPCETRRRCGVRCPSVFRAVRPLATFHQSRPFGRAISLFLGLGRAGQGRAGQGSGIGGDPPRTFDIECCRPALAFAFFC